MIIQISYLKVTVSVPSSDPVYLYEALSLSPDLSVFVLSPLRSYSTPCP